MEGGELCSHSETKWSTGNLFFVGCLEARCHVLLPPAGLSYTSLVCDALKVDAQNSKFSSDSTVKKTPKVDREFLYYYKNVDIL